MVAQQTNSNINISLPMENKGNNQQNSLNRSFIPQLTSLLYQQNQILLYHQLSQNNTYNALTSNPQFPQNINFIQSNNCSFPQFNSSQQLFMSYRAENQQIISQAPRDEPGTNAGSNSSSDGSENQVKQEHIEEAQNEGHRFQEGSFSNSDDHDNTQKKKNPNYYWSPEQNKKYYDFVRNNVQWLKLRYHKRKNLKINVLMSNQIVTRTPVQCHSHHQKMMQKYKTVGNLLRKMKAHHQPKIHGRGKNQQEEESVKVEEELPGFKPPLSKKQSQ